MRDELADIGHIIALIWLFFLQLLAQQVAMLASTQSPSAARLVHGSIFLLRISFCEWQNCKWPPHSLIPLILWAVTFSALTTFPYKCLDSRSNEEEGKQCWMILHDWFRQYSTWQKGNKVFCKHMRSLDWRLMHVITRKDLNRVA